MAYTVIFDQDAELACLIEPDAGYAFGPTVGGPRGRDILDTFAGSLPADPAALPAWQLADAFRAFMGAMVEEPETAPTAPLEPPRELFGGPADAQAGAADAAERSPEDAAAIGQEHRDQLDGGEDGGEVRYVECPNCHAQNAYVDTPPGQCSICGDVLARPAGTGA